jgi:hypothetical protein
LLYVAGAALLGQCGKFLHDAEDMVLKMMSKRRAVPALFLLAVSIGETDASTPIATFGIRDDPDTSL